MKHIIKPLLKQSLENLKNKLEWMIEIPDPLIEATKDKQFGDFASNIALVLAKKVNLKPRDLADSIIKELPASNEVAKVEIAGPGFINFFLTPQSLHSVVSHILNSGERYGYSDIGKEKKINVEFVSSNPTGPLHVGHGRHAAFGDSVANLLEAIGYSVYREYYVNDAGRQMDILAVSVWIRYLQIQDQTIIFPSNGYKGDYVFLIAQELKDKYGDRFVSTTEKVFNKLPLDEVQGGDKELYIDALIARARALLNEQNYQLIFNHSLNLILEDIKKDLAEFGVYFQNWFSEKEFTKGPEVDRIVEKLRQSQHAYERDGALWFRSTDFGDEKDRVLARSNGQRTYFANDLVYHVNKFERNFESAIDIFGSDHHGYIPRMKAGLKALDINQDRLTYLLVQFVNLYRNGVQIPMSTRSGSFIPLRELRQEVGNDAARFFYVMRKSEQPMDFDLELAKSKSNENPVYYIQYAHARICSVFRQLEDKKIDFHQQKGIDNLNLLIKPHEIKILNTLILFPDMIQNAALSHEPQIVTTYLRELANDFHAYYNSEQFIVEDELLRHARLSLILSARQVIANGLKLIGVSAPTSM